MDNTQKQTYFCVSCGEEIKPEQLAYKTMVSLSYAALDGASDTTIDRIPVYVTRDQIEKLINRYDASGKQYLTLSEYLGFAYDSVNWKDLNESRAADAQTALEIYHESLEEAASAGYLDFDDDTSHDIIIPGFNETVTAQIMKNFPNDICFIEWKINDTNGYFFHLTDKVDAKKKITS